MRYHFSLFVVFSVGALVSVAAPPRVNKEDVQAGKIYWPRLKFVHPEDPGVKALQVQCILARNK